MDLIISACTGVALSICLIYFNIADINAETSASKEDEKDNDNDSIMNLTKKLIGDTEDGYPEEINMNWELRIDQILNWLAFILFLVISGYMLQIHTNGDFMRVVIAIFPSEFETLGMKDYFERFNYNSTIQNLILPRINVSQEL